LVLLGKSRTHSPPQHGGKKESKKKEKEQKAVAKAMRSEKGFNTEHKKRRERGF